MPPPQPELDSVNDLMAIEGGTARELCHGEMLLHNLDGRQYHGSYQPKLMHKTAFSVLAAGMEPNEALPRFSSSSTRE